MPYTPQLRPYFHHPSPQHTTTLLFTIIRLVSDRIRLGNRAECAYDCWDAGDGIAKRIDYAERNGFY